MAGDSTALPAAKVTGSTFGSSTLSAAAPREQPAERLERRGHHVHQHVLDRRPDGVAERELGIVDGAGDGDVGADVPFLVLDERDDQPERQADAALDLVAAAGRRDLELPDATSFSADSWLPSSLNRTLYWRSPFLMTHPMAADAYGSTLGSLKLRSSPTRST